MPEKEKKAEEPRVGICRDMIQEFSDSGPLEIPEIRVWIHPHAAGTVKPGEDGSDYYQVFSSFKEADEFAKKTPGAEPNFLIAFRGWELNLHTLRLPLPRKKG